MRGEVFPANAGMIRGLTVSVYRFVLGSPWMRG